MFGFAASCTNNICLGLLKMILIVYKNFLMYIYMCVYDHGWSTLYTYLHSFIGLIGMDAWHGQGPRGDRESWTHQEQYITHMTKPKIIFLHVMINNNDKIDDGRYDDKPPHLLLKRKERRRPMHACPTSIISLPFLSFSPYCAGSHKTPFVGRGPLPREGDKQIWKTALWLWQYTSMKSIWTVKCQQTVNTHKRLALSGPTFNVLIPQAVVLTVDSWFDGPGKVFKIC